jgi:hypothetical protein
MPDDLGGPTSGRYVSKGSSDSRRRPAAELVGFTTFEVYFYAQ